VLQFLSTIKRTGNVVSPQRISHDILSRTLRILNRACERSDVNKFNGGHSFIRISAWPCDVKQRKVDFSFKLVPPFLHHRATSFASRTHYRPIDVTFILIPVSSSSFRAIITGNCPPRFLLPSNGTVIKRVTCISPLRPFYPREFRKKRTKGKGAHNFGIYFCREHGKFFTKPCRLWPTDLPSASRLKVCCEKGGQASQEVRRWGERRPERRESRFGHTYVMKRRALGAGLGKQTRPASGKVTPG